MDKKKWPWKRRSSEKIPGETENSGSLSSLSERLSDEPITDVLKEIPIDQSPEVTSKASEQEEVNDTVKALAEKLSAALVNVSAKDDLVRQHSKVAEEAVAGWEKAENEALMLKKQLAISVKQKLAIEDRMTHVDEALKECVRQLRVSREEQEQKIQASVAKRTEELETHLREAKLNLERVSETMGIEYLEEENASLRYELEVRTIERDLSSQTAEAASKQYLESIKKIAKLEAECRKLKFLMGKDYKTPSVSSLYVDSFTDSQSDSGDRMNAVELDQETFPSTDIDLMEDFIEMEKLAALPESEPEMILKEFDQREINELMNKNSELEEQIIQLTETEAEVISLKEEMAAKIRSLEKELEKERVISAELAVKSKEMSEKMKSLQKELEKERDISFELDAKYKEMAAKIKSLENELDISVGLDVKCEEMAAKIESLEKELEKERDISVELAVKYEEMKEECEINRTVRAQITPIINQEELDLAADKYAECQKTILSLGSHLKSLATLEDFLLDIGSIPTLSENETVVSELIRSQSDYSGHCDVNRNGFAKFFSKNKNDGLCLEI